SAFLNKSFFYMPVSIRLLRSVFIGSTGEPIVDKRHVVADEYVIGDVNALTNKCVAGYFAVLTDGGAFLYLYESAHFTAIIYTASVGIHEVEYPYVFAHLYVFQALFIGVYIKYFHFI